MNPRRLSLAVGLTLLLVGCAHPQLHPGAVSRLDSSTYDVLYISQAVIEQARAESTAGTLPDALKPPLNTLINAYNVARASWLTYRSAVKLKTPADVGALNRNINLLSTALRGFQSARSIPQ